MKNKSNPVKLVIDTDIGTDADDAFAVAYAIKNPKADLKAITTVQGIPITRAKIAEKLEKIIGVDIPITAGKKGPFPNKWIKGFEKKALTKKELKTPFKNNPFPTYDKNTKLVCLGPLTNIAYQLDNNPSIKNVQEIYIMGVSAAAHNIAIDKKASEKVFQQPWKIYQVGTIDSKKIYFTRKQLEKLRKNELGNFLADSEIRWMNCKDQECLSFFNKMQKGEIEQGSIGVMYDVLTVSAALNEGYVQFKRYPDIERHYSNGVSRKLKDKIIEVINK